MNDKSNHGGCHLLFPIIAVLSLLCIAPTPQLWAGESSDEAAEGEPTVQEHSAAVDDVTVPILEDIKVTARRYEEYLQLVPASVTVMTADYLQDQGLTNVRDIVDFAPGGVTTSFNKMQDRYSLRGISSKALPAIRRWRRSSTTWSSPESS